jgi:hypothetical protein
MLVVMQIKLVFAHHGCKRIKGVGKWSLDHVGRLIF